MSIPQARLWVPGDDEASLYVANITLNGAEVSVLRLILVSMEQTPELYLLGTEQP